MPYSGPGDKSLPSNVKKLPKKKRSKWVKTWNSAYAACIKDGGSTDTCESKAFRIANGTIEENIMRDHVLFIKLADLVEGQPFDGLVAGTFVAMSGRKIEIPAEDLPEYLANTLGAIEATRTEGGEVVGLPIDIQNHDEDDAAGWIMDAELSDDVLRFTPKWTDVGVEALDKGIRRFFSATIDTIRKVVYGGTLTNWPATRDHETGFTLLRPIELAHLTQAAFAVDDESLDERTMRVRYAWWQAEPMREGSESYVVEVFDDFIVIERSDGYFRVPYTEDEGEIDFAGPAEWTKVRKAWIDLAKQTARRILSALMRREGTDENEDEVPPDELGDHPSQKPSEGDEQMSFNLDDLTAEQKAELVEKLAERLSLGEPASEDADPELGGPLQKLIEDRADKLVAVRVAAAERKSEIERLAKGLIEGTDEVPAGLPIVETDLVAFLEGLSDEQREVAAGIFDKVLANGIVDFSTRGHGRRIEGKTELPEDMQAELVKYLENGEENTVAEFFSINAPDLGPMSDYDLSKFEKEA